MGRKPMATRGTPSWVHTANPRCFGIGIPDVARDSGWSPPPPDPRISGVCDVKQWYRGIFVTSEGEVYAVGEHVFRIDRRGRCAEWVGTFDRLHNELLDVVAGQLLTADSWLSKPGVYFAGKRLDIPDELGCPQYSHSDPVKCATVISLERGVALLGPKGDLLGACELSGGKGRPDVRRWVRRQVALWPEGVVIAGNDIWSWNPRTDELRCLSRRSELLCMLENQALIRGPRNTLKVMNADGSTAFRWREPLESHVEHAVLHQNGAWLITSGHYNYLNREDAGLQLESYPFTGDMKLDVIDDVASRLGDRFVLAADCPTGGGSIVVCDSRDVHWCPWSGNATVPVFQTEWSMIRDAVWLDERHLLVGGEQGDIYAVDLGQDLARIPHI